METPAKNAMKGDKPRNGENPGQVPLDVEIAAKEAAARERS